MPIPLIKSLAKKSGKSVDDVDKIWNEIKPKIFKEYSKLSDNSKYAILTKTVERILKTSLNESNIDRKSELKSAIIKNKRLTHIGYGNYKDPSGNIMKWNDLKNDFMDRNKDDETFSIEENPIESHIQNIKWHLAEISKKSDTEKSLESKKFEKLTKELEDVEKEKKSGKTKILHHYGPISLRKVEFK